MNSKLVFFDLDGTIWDFNGVIPQSAMKAIELLNAKGNIPVICSGRAKGHIRDKALFDMNFKGIVAACGAHVEYDSKMIYEKYLTDDQVKEIIRLSKDCKVPLVLEGPKKHWISSEGFEKDDFVHRMYKVMKEDALSLDDFKEGMKVNKFSGDFIRISDADTFKNEISKTYKVIWHGLTPDVNQNPDMNPSAIVGVFEAIIPGITKADGIRMFCENLGADPSKAYAIGDSNNDLDMIECVGTGIAMGNASQSLKEVADYVTDDIHKDGIFNALKHFDLI